MHGEKKTLKKRRQKNSYRDLKIRMTADITSDTMQANDSGEISLKY